MSWKYIGITFVLILGLFVQACARKVKPEESCNFVQNSVEQRVSWGEKAPVEMLIHESVPVEHHEVIRQAAHAWNELAGKELITIVQVGVGGSNVPVKDGYSIITMMDTWDPDKEREQARTSVYWRGKQILEADIRINNADFKFSIAEEVEPGKVDLYSLILHEMGHVLGLAHIEEDHSVMHPELSKGQDRRDLDKSGPDFWSINCEY